MDGLEVGRGWVSGELGSVEERVSGMRSIVGCFADGLVVDVSGI